MIDRETDMLYTSDTTQHHASAIRIQREFLTVKLITTVMRYKQSRTLLTSSIVHKNTICVCARTVAKGANRALSTRSLSGLSVPMFPIAISNFSGRSSLKLNPLSNSKSDR